MRTSINGICLGAVWLIATVWVSAADESPKPPRNSGPVETKVTTKATEPAGTEAETESPDGRMREGAKLIEQIGEFQKAGDQVNFYLPNRKTELRVLPNLALERVVRVLEDNPAVRTWSVSGVITEYQGENYLLVTRAVLKARPTQPLTRKRRLPAEAEKADQP